VTEWAKRFRKAQKGRRDAELHRLADEMRADMRERIDQAQRLAEAECADDMQRARELTAEIEAVQSRVAELDSKLKTARTARDWGRARGPKLSRTQSAARARAAREERAERIRSDVDPELVRVFDAAGGAREFRSAEQFAEWVEAHPDAVAELAGDAAEAEAAALIAEAWADQADDDLADVPF